MDINHVTFASESMLKHTNVFLNKNLFQCYHNNRGYCSFREKCRYQHFKDICSKTIGREKHCEKSHPVVCRYKEECKFYKAGYCAFKHEGLKKDVAKSGKDLEIELKLCADEIKSLKREIKELKNYVKIKEEKLKESKMEIENLKTNLTHSPKPSDQNLEKDTIKENNDLKQQIDILENENKALKMKLSEKTGITHQDEDKISMTVKHSCVRCCLDFSSKERLDKHKSEMHKAKLTF